MNPQDNPKEWRDLVTRLSCQFSDDLSVDIGDPNLHEVVNRNQWETNPSTCHSHDFCDANMTMRGSFITVFDREPTQADQYLIDSAWSEAKEFNFNLS